MRLVHRAKLVEGAVDDAAFMIVHQFQRDAAQAEDQDAGMQHIGFKPLLREAGAAGELHRELMNWFRPDWRQAAGRALARGPGAPRAALA